MHIFSETEGKCIYLCDFSVFSFSIADLTCEILLFSCFRSEGNCITNIITHGIGSWPEMCSSFRPRNKEEVSELVIFNIHILYLLLMYFCCCCKEMLVQIFCIKLIL